MISGLGRIPIVRNYILESSAIFIWTLETNLDLWISRKRYHGETGTYAFRHQVSTWE